MVPFHKPGVHVPNGGEYPDLDLMLDMAGDSYTILDVDGYIDVIKRIRAKRPRARILVRYYHPTWHTLNPHTWAEHCARRYAEHRDVTRHCTWANEQNLEYPIDWNAPPSNMEARACYEQINAWNIEFIETFEKLVPDAILHYPALAPNHQSDNDDSGWGWLGYDILRPSIEMLGWLDVHVYWKAGGAGLWDSDRIWYAGRYELVRKFFPDHIFFISECGNFATTDADFDRQIGDFFAMIAPVPYIAGATPFIWADPTGAHWQNDWHKCRDLPGLVRTLRELGDRLEPATIMPGDAPRPAPEPPKEEPTVKPFHVDGRLMSIEEFARHVESLPPRKITAVCVHHTAKPQTPEDWLRYGGWAHYKDVLVQYYRDTKGWDRGPQVFACPDGVGLLTPLTMDGNGVEGRNAGVWHVEVVGNYMGTLPSGETLTISFEVVAILLRKAGLTVENGLTYHRKLANGGSECPGDEWVANWAWFAGMVRAEISLITMPSAVTLPEQEPAQTAKELAGKVTWWDEERQRKVEQAMLLLARADEISRSNIKLAYRLQEAIAAGR